jgi:hypothetical protein
MGRFPDSLAPRSRPVPTRLAVAALLVLASFSSSVAQWSSDPATNLPIADAASDQILPKIAPTSDGGCWISWFDGIANGFDVRVQLLDAAGNEQLAHGGVLVADRGFSSVQDYGLDVAGDDSAVLAFRDDGGVGVQITAARVATDGTLVWGTTGVQVTSTTEFVASPKVTSNDLGSTIVAWTQDATVRIQSLDGSGAPQFGPGVILTPTTGSYSVSDLHDAGTDAILGFVHQTGGFGSPRHLFAQKIGANGATLWGGSHVAVFDGGSLQFGNFPVFEPDGAGGAVFSWYDTSTLQFRVYAQHILANGSETFPHNGSSGSTNATRVRVSPSVSYDPGTGETFLFWEEQNSTQSQFGLYGQKFDAIGLRQWTDDGTELVSVGGDELRMVRTLAAGGKAFVFWSTSPSFGQNLLVGAQVGAGGTFSIAPFYVSSAPSGKSRLVAARSTAGFSILAWSDDRNDGGDVLAQNVNADGTLGPVATGVPVSSRGAEPLLGRGYPNPARQEVRFEVLTSSEFPAEWSVFDAGGRRIYGESLTLGAGPRSVGWDLRDNTGRTVPSGVYFVRLNTREGSAVRRVVRVR